MRLASLLAGLGLLSVPAVAQTRHPAPRPAAPAHAAAHAAGPRSIGKFDDWQAATHDEGGQTACYAFTRASGSSPSLAGRGDVVLTVTERAGGRDAVAISAGFAYPQNAEVTMEVGDSKLPFYTDKRSAFARDGRAAVAAFERGSRATAHSPAPRNAQVADTFSLRGFSGAYAAITKACPK